jgi:hypothetical protein
MENSQIMAFFTVMTSPIVQKKNFHNTKYLLLKMILSLSISTYCDLVNVSADFAAHTNLC